MSDIIDLSGAGANTVIDYGYRDGANYKTAGQAVLAGRISPSDAAALCRNLYDGEAFIPGQVGLQDLQDSFSGCESEWNPDFDHPYHELFKIKYSGATPTHSLSADEFARQMMSATWDDEYKPPFYMTMESRYTNRIAREQDAELML